MGAAQGISQLREMEIKIVSRSIDSVIKRQTGAATNIHEVSRHKSRLDEIAERLGEEGRECGC